MDTASKTSDKETSQLSEPPSDLNPSSSDSDSPAHHTEWLATARQRRSTAGNRMKFMLANEEPDSDLELLFAEDENDQGFLDVEDDGSDARMDSSSDDEDDKTTNVDELEGEKELERQLKARTAARRKGRVQEAIPARFRKKARLDSTTAMASPAPAGHRPKKKTERTSWLPSAADLPTRASSRKTTRISKEQLHQQMAEREARRLRQLAQMEKKAARLEALKKPPMTQEQRLREAAIVEKRNSKSLNRWEEAEKQREEERKARLAALNQRTLEGPVLTFWSGPGQWDDAELRSLCPFVTEVEEKPKKKRDKVEKSVARGKGLKSTGGDGAEAQQKRTHESKATATCYEKNASQVRNSPKTTDINSESARADITLIETAPSADVLEPKGQHCPREASDSHVDDNTRREGAVISALHSPSNLDEDRESSSHNMSQFRDVPASTVISSDPLTHLFIETPFAQALESAAQGAEPSQGLAAPTSAPETPEPPSIEVSQSNVRLRLSKKVSQLGGADGNVLEPAQTPQAVKTASHYATLPPIDANSSPAPTQRHNLPPHTDTVGTSMTTSPSHSETLYAPDPPFDTNAARNAIIYQNFNDAALRDKSIQTQILFGRKMTKLAKPAPAPMCVITNNPARYRDPQTGLPFSNVDAYKQLRSLYHGEYNWSRLVGAWVGSGIQAARGVPERFVNPQLSKLSDDGVVSAETFQKVPPQEGQEETKKGPPQGSAGQGTAATS